MRLIVHMSCVFSVCTKSTASAEAFRPSPALKSRSGAIVGWACAIAAGVILWAGLAVLFGERDGRMLTLAGDCAVTTYRDPVTGRVQTAGASASTGEKRRVCATR